MSSGMPRIKTVSVVGPMRLLVIWRGAADANDIDLSHWIATGGDTLAPLSDPKMFLKAAAFDNGAAVSWDRGEGDLSIDAVHLRAIAERL